VRTAFTDSDDAGEIHANGFEIRVRIEREQSHRVELDPCGEEVARLTGDDHSRIDEFAAIDAWHHAHDGVVIRALHEEPPRETVVGPEPVA
jgi:hypothetical protein